MIPEATRSSRALWAGGEKNTILVRATPKSKKNGPHDGRSGSHGTQEGNHRGENVSACELNCTREQAPSAATPPCGGPSKPGDTQAPADSTRIHRQPNGQEETEKADDCHPNEKAFKRVHDPASLSPNIVLLTTLRDSYVKVRIQDLSAYFVAMFEC